MESERKIRKEVNMFERLSYEEIVKEKGKWRNRDKEFGMMPWPQWLTQAQVKATLKDVIEWGESDCLHDYRLLKRKCSKCWQELKDQVERMK